MTTTSNGHSAPTAELLEDAPETETGGDESPNSASTPSKSTKGRRWLVYLAAIGVAFLVSQRFLPRDVPPVEQALPPQEEPEPEPEPSPEPSPSPSPEASVLPLGGNDALTTFVLSGYSAIGTGQDARAELYYRKAQESGEAEFWLAEQFMQKYQEFYDRAVVYGNLAGEADQAAILRADLGDLVAIARAMEMMKASKAPVGAAVRVEQMATQAELVKKALMTRYPALAVQPVVVPASQPLISPGAAP